MLTLSVMVLVFLVGYYLGVWNTLTRVDEKLGPHVRALEELRQVVDHRERPCPGCGSTGGTFSVEVGSGRPGVQQVCNNCLMAQDFRYLDDGR